MSDSDNKKGGMSALEFLMAGLTIAFVVMKLCKVITWSWVWVLAPMWIPIAGIFAFILIVVVIKLITVIADEVRK